MLLVIAKHFWRQSPARLSYLRQAVIFMPGCHLPCQAVLLHARMSSSCQAVIFMHLVEDFDVYVT